MKQLWAFGVGIAMVLGTAGFGASASWAQPAASAKPEAPAAGQAAPAGGDRRMAMTETVSASDFKKIEGAPLLIAAYAVVWVVFFSALGFTFVRLRRLRADVARLEAELRRGGGGA